VIYKILTSFSTETASKLAIGRSEERKSDENTGIAIAAKRLAEEARQAASYGIRGIRDVTEEFAAAAKLLPPGQLVKDEYFTLFEAVGALEV